MKVILTLTGTNWMLMHNERLANPLDEYSKQKAKYTAKRKKTEEDFIAIMSIEARGGCWETEDHLLGIPDVAVWSSILAAAKGFKMGKDIQRALLFEDLVRPLFLNGGGEIDCDEYIQGIAEDFVEEAKDSLNELLRLNNRPTQTGFHNAQVAKDIMKEIEDAEN